MKKSNAFLWLALLLVSFSACKEELDVTAPYKEIPIVYGLLDKDLSVQYIKVTRAFLLEDGSAIDAAKIADSNYFNFDNTEVKLIAYLNNQKVDSVILDTVHLPKTDGIFANSNIFYRTPNGYTLLHAPTTTKDTTWAEYELIIRKKAENTILAKSRTTIVNDFAFAGSLFELKFYNLSLDKYLDQNLTWRTAKNAGVYKMFLRLNFTEESDLTGDSVLKYVDMPLISNSFVDYGSTTNIGYTLKGEDFFKHVGSSLEPLPSSYRRKYKGPVEFHFTVGGTGIAELMRLTGDTFTLTDIRPEVSNIENGIGIFSSRSRKVFKDIKQTNLSQESISQLKTGKYTGHLGFN